MVRKKKQLSDLMIAVTDNFVHFFCSILFRIRYLPSVALTIYGARLIRLIRPFFNDFTEQK